MTSKPQRPDVDALCPDISESARKIESSILQALSRVGQVHVAQATGISESEVSKWKADIPRIARILAAASLKTVGSDRHCVRADEFQLITRIASRALANEDAARTMLFEDVE